LGHAVVIYPFYTWNLEQWLKTFKPATRDKHLVAYKLIEAVKAGHKLSLTHGRIKANNILFQKHGEPYLSDWTF